MNFELIHDAHVRAAVRLVWKRYQQAFAELAKQ